MLFQIVANSWLRMAVWMARPQHVVQYVSWLATHATPWWEMVWPCASLMRSGRLTPRVLWKVRCLLFIQTRSPIKTFLLKSSFVYANCNIYRNNFLKSVKLCLIWLHCVLDCGDLTVPNGSLNDTSSTCGTALSLTCDPCYDLEGTGFAVCRPDETWAFASQCAVKGKHRLLRLIERMLNFLTMTYL